jgi:hypothetical protein
MGLHGRFQIRWAAESRDGRAVKSTALSCGPAMPSSYVAVLRAVNAGEPARTTRFPSLTGGTQLIEAAAGNCLAAAPYRQLRA